MKILFLKEKRSESGFEGSAIYLQRLCIFLNSKNIQYLVLYNSRDEYYASLKKNNVNVKLFNFITETPKNIFRKYTKLRKIKNSLSKIINDGNFNIINCHFPQLLLFVDKKFIKDRQIICHWHGAETINTPLKKFYWNELISFNFRKIITSYYRRNYIYDFSKINKLVAVSNASKNTAHITFGVDEKKIYLNTYGVEKLDINKCKTIHNEFGINKDNKIILSAGRITKDKGVEDFCEVAKKLSSNELKFIFLGGYRDKDYYNKILDKYGKYVIFPGMRTDIYNFYFSSDIFLFLSHRESAGIVLMESMQFSLPLVGWNIIGVNEIIIDDYNGNLINFGNINLVTQKINNILNDENIYTKFSSNSYKSFTNYNINDNYNRLIEIFNS